MRIKRWFPRGRTSRGYTTTRLWALIDWFMNQEAVKRRRAERAEAKEKEEAAARERTRRDNSAAAFDRKMQEARKRNG